MANPNGRPKAAPLSGIASPTFSSRALEALARDSRRAIASSNYRSGQAAAMVPVAFARPTKVGFDALHQECELVAQRRLAQPEVATLLVAFAARRRGEFFAEVAETFR